MICEPCRDAGNLPANGVFDQGLATMLHAECKGGTWCDCAHITDFGMVKKSA